MSRYLILALFLIGLCLAGPMQERAEQGMNQYPTAKPTSTRPKHGYPTKKTTSRPIHKPTSYPSTCPKPSTVTTTVTATVTASATQCTPTTTTDTTTTATTTTTTPTTTTTTATAQPTFNCPPEGYIISSDGRSLLTVDISTGQRTPRFASVGDEGVVNALGYNILDNTFWASTLNSGPILHIFSDGSIETLPGQSGNVNIGDVDSAGSYWTSAGGTQWFQYDVNPLSPTYGELANSGTSAAPPDGVRVNDWVNVPVTGPYFYSLVFNSTTEGTSIVRWSSVTHQWERFANYPEIKTSGWNAAYGVNDGTLYGTDNDNRNIWSFPLLGTGEPFIVSTDSGDNSQDAARCVNNFMP